VTLEQLRLTVRCYSPPMREGIDTVGQLAVLPERHLTGLWGFTPEAMGELKYKLRQLGLSPWAAPQPAGNQGGSGTAGQLPGPGRPGGLCLGRGSSPGTSLPGRHPEQLGRSPGSGKPRDRTDWKEEGMAPAGTSTPDR
jgi:hypothetical protein